MKNVIYELKSSFVLTRQEIERIKLFVAKKYPNNSSKQNALILARTMYEIIDKNLEGINKEQKQNIRKSIIQSTILKDKENILKWDVFNAYIIKSEENPQLKSSLIQWINNNQIYTVSKENFEAYLEALHDTSDKENSPYKVTKLVDKQNGVNYRGLSIYRKHFKRMILRCKRSLLSKNNNIHKKIKVLLEAVLNKLSSKKIALSVLTLLILSLYFLNNPINSNILGGKIEGSQNYASRIQKYDLYVTDVMSYHPNLPNSFNYKSIDENKLSQFLNAKNSMLAEEPYFSAIIRTSREFNLNPNILFAITGQEQSFVPKNHEYAEKIANNPFNVFHSWQEYNTDIYDSSRIAARTIINLSKDKPNNVDIFDWINNKYAYDKSWGKGVKEIFETLNN